jgi:hypothetical protein
VSVAVIFQHAQRLRHVILPSAPLYHIFAHYHTNGTIFEKKVTELNMCVLIFSTTFA